MSAIPSTHIENGKHKREDTTESLSNRPHLHIPGIDTAASSPGVIDSPLHSPTSSSGHHGGLATNGHAASRRPSAKLTRKRNIDRVHFGAYDIKTWYYSPYQFDEEEWAALANTTANGNPGGSSSNPTQATKNHSRSETTTSTTSTLNPDSLVESIPLRHGGALSNSAEHAPALQATTNGEARVQIQNEEPVAKSIWICDGCFKYMRTYPGFKAHKRQCNLTHPPGKKVYQRGAHTIWEVDGSLQKLYCQNLSLFGKLFIDHKTIYFDVEPFVFYVLTDATAQFDHVLGYFSKEKVSYDDYNLACIITFPPFQKHGFGTLMIEFSYHLSAINSVAGTPERPLSDLGLRGYLTFWSAVALRTLALFFHDQDEDVQGRILPPIYTATSSSRANKQQAQPNAATLAIFQQRQKDECLRIRRILVGKALPGDKQPKATTKTTGKRGRPSSEGGDLTGTLVEDPLKKKMASGVSDPGSSQNDAVQSATHPLLKIDENEPITLHTSLERLSEATNLRMEDLTLALSECGLLQRKAVEHEPLQLIITRDLVRSSLRKFNVKRPILDVNYVLV
ncbi:acyl-CoA N-acyltransferase [Meira miltonrushii]|uniref:histone acetyltransferase n=1 Tax=Meira miltonrushii TaxID=1280837 RepID=A0A316V723_9BASI|nr:acyl-CoA N-acyltransferase [Meira miltonrushii]PWN32994.1 acyl-CoA N-acyltransferase [Meira miltonrushii]